MQGYPQSTDRKGLLAWLAFNGIPSRYVIVKQGACVCVCVCMYVLWMSLRAYFAEDYAHRSRYMCAYVNLSTPQPNPRIHITWMSSFGTFSDERFKNCRRLWVCTCVDTNTYTCPHIQLYACPHVNRRTVSDGDCAHHEGRGGPGRVY